MRRVSRREFISGAVVVVGAALASACGATPTPTPIPSPTKPAAPTAAAPAPAAPTATAAPAAPTATTAAKPTVAPTAVPSPVGTPRLGASLKSNKVEGVEVISDASKFPKSFKEAPQLTELVKAGKLPPVEQRLPQDPLVIKPVHEIGKYGGVLRRGFTGPGDTINGLRTAAGPDMLLYLDYTLTKIVPNIAKAYELSQDGRVFTVYLRRGMKWSDGDPFDADDFVFAYEDLIQNKELVPVRDARLSIGGKPGTMEKVDTYTVRWVFPDPYPLFPRVMALFNTISSWTQYGKNGTGPFAPVHYLKQFHPKYTPKEQLDAKVKEAKFDNWINLFKFKNDWSLNPELPVISPWKTVTPANTPVWTLERNPYSIWVDTDGNQLPYIDKCVLTLAETTEVLNLRAIAGEYDMQARHIDIAKIPVLIENQQKGNYKVSLNPGDWGSDYGFWFNMNYAADAEIQKWFNITDFRRALSLGIDRNAINETFFLGMGVPGSAAPAETNIYSPGPEYRTLWSTYEPAKANDMLDKIGLNKKDAEGYRLRSDGKGRLTLELTCPLAAQINLPGISEMIAQQWKKIGIELKVNALERSLADKRNGTNENQMYAWMNDSSDDLISEPDKTFPSLTTHPMPLFGKWFATNGKDGVEPPAEMKQAMDLWRKAQGATPEEAIKIGKEIWKIALDQVWYVGVVGQSGASEGIQVTKVDLGNVPERFLQITRVFAPNICRPVQFYWKKPQQT